MRQRSRSAVGVVIVGIVPTLLGGPIFAATMALLCLIGFQEYAAMTARLGARPPAATFVAGYLAVVAFAFAALAGAGEQAALGIVAAALAIPLVVVMVRREQGGALVGWALAAAGSLYLGLPAFAAVALRGTAGRVDAGWLRRLAERGAVGWDAAPRGLAWVLVIILDTWLADTCAYLVGRFVAGRFGLGRHSLIPRVSPHKTVEGAVGGFLGAAATGALTAWLFGLGVSAWLGAAIGLVLAVVGLVGDLAESLLKRQAGVKDSGALIPGHGGMLDRIDALLFTWVAGWYLATLVDRWTS